MDWIRKNPQLALIVTEVTNIALHGVGTAPAVAFTFGGTLVNAAVIFVVPPLQSYVAKAITKFNSLRNKEVA